MLDTTALRARLSPGARLTTGEGERALYSRDCWPWLNLHARDGAIARFPPDVVVFPASEDDVVAVVGFCRETGTPLIPVGGLSGVVGAAVPVRGGVALDLKRLDDLDAGYASSGLVRAGAGWIGARLEHELNRRGLTLGHFPSSLGCSTLGGYVATRSAGQLSSRHGKIEDLVVGVRWVGADGAIRDSFSAPGDPTALLIGSEGTLGVILDVWLRVEQRPRFRAYRGYLAQGVAPALEAMRGLLQSGHRPAVLRLYDEFDTYISGARKAGVHRAPPGLVRRLAARATGALDLRSARHAGLVAANAILGRSLGAPLVLNRLAAKTYPGCLLIVGVEEPDDEVLQASAADVFGAVSLTDLGEGPGAHWHEHRYKVSYKMSPLVSAGLFVDTMEVATSWAQIETLYHAVKSALASHVFVMAHFSHAYVTGCSIYFTFAGFAASEAECRARYEATWRAAMEAVAREGAAVTHHHGVGLMKVRALADDQGAGSAALFAGVKRAFDPTGFLNPGKLWDTAEAFP